LEFGLGSSGKPGEPNFFQATACPNWCSSLGDSEIMDWLSGMDSNHDKSLQRALCYHYTTGQAPQKVCLVLGGAKKILPSLDSPLALPIMPRHVFQEG
jgi:hypothetical protein